MVTHRRLEENSQPSPKIVGDAGNFRSRVAAGSNWWRRWRARGWRPPRGSGRRPEIRKLGRKNRRKFRKLTASSLAGSTCAPASRAGRWCSSVRDVPHAEPMCSLAREYFLRIGARLRQCPKRSLPILNLCGKCSHDQEFPRSDAFGSCRCDGRCVSAAGRCGGSPLVAQRLVLHLFLSCDMLTIWICGARPSPTRCAASN